MIQFISTHIKFILFLIVAFSINCVIAQTIVSKNGKFGLINKEADFILPMEYDTIYELKVNDIYRTRIFTFKKKEKFGLYNSVNQKKTGLQFDEINLDHSRGGYILKTDDLYGFLIEPESFVFDWVLPKYDEVRMENGSINDFIPDSYNYQHGEKGFTVRMGSLWGYASYIKDSLIIDINYSKPVDQLFSERHFFRTYDSKTGIGFIINAKNQCSFEVENVRFLKQHINYFLHTYYIEAEPHCVIYDLLNCSEINDIKMADFEDFPNIDFIDYHYLKISGVAKRLKRNQPDQTLSIFYNMSTGAEIFRFKGMYCQKIRFEYPYEVGSPSNSEVWINKHCGQYRKLYGKIIDDKFSRIKK